MEKEPFTLSESMQKLIRMYQKVYTIIFRYSVFAICFVLASLIAIKQSQRVDLEVYEEAEEFAVHKISLTKSFNNFIQQQVDNPDIDVSILQGSLQSTGDFLQSNNNLLHYKGYVVPRVFFLYSTVPLIKKNMLTGNYDIRKMESFAQNVVFTAVPEDLYAEPFKRAQLPLYKWLVDSFNISCIFKPKFLQGTCDHYVKNFLGHVFIYDLSTSYDELETLSRRLKKKWRYHEDFCNTMTKYALYSNDTSLQLEPIFRDCGDENLQYFHSLQGFVEVQNQFQSNYTTEYLYSDYDLNIYKLLSLQQIIYNDIRSRKLNDRILFPYFAYVETLLKQDKLDSFYKDMTYWFHNYYIKTRLSEPIFANKKDIVDHILGGVNQINKWSHLVWYTWLAEQISNKNLLIEKADTSKFLEPVQLSTEELFKNLANLNFLTITSYDIQWDKLSMEWVLSVTDKNNTHQINIILSLKKQNNFLLINKVIIPDYPVLAEVIQNLLKKNMRSVANLYQYIRENFNFYTSGAGTLSTCDIIKNKVGSRYVIECSDNYIYLQRQVSGPPTKYFFTIDNHKVTNLEVTDPELNKELQTEIVGIETNRVTLPSLVSFVFQYQKNVDEELETETIQEALIIVEKLKKYLWVDPDEIYEENDTIFVRFQVQWVSYLVEYNTLTHDLWPLYFYNVYYRQGKRLPVKNFFLALDDNNKTTINNFVVDPLGYIESINENAYKAYLKYK